MFSASSGGWFRESYRHSLAARGIQTKRFSNVAKWKSIPSAVNEMSWKKVGKTSDLPDKFKILRNYNLPHGITLSSDDELLFDRKDARYFLQFATDLSSIEASQIDKEAAKRGLSFNDFKDYVRDKMNIEWEFSSYYDDSQELNDYEILKNELMEHSAISEIAHRFIELPRDYFDDLASEAINSDNAYLAEYYKAISSDALKKEFMEDYKEDIKKIFEESNSFEDFVSELEDYKNDEAFYKVDNFLTDAFYTYVLPSSKKWLDSEKAAKENSNVLLYQLYLSKGESWAKNASADEINEILRRDDSGIRDALGLEVSDEPVTYEEMRAKVRFEMARQNPAQRKINSYTAVDVDYDA
jgi:hypothetical protein